MSNSSMSGRPPEGLERFQPDSKELPDRGLLDW
jgi:hypothetical protein